MTVFIILGFLLALVGLAGSILPVVPGPPLSFLALIILSFVKNWEPFSAAFLIIMAGLIVVVTLFDYVAPAAGAKKYGASRWAVWGSIIGTLMGLFFFPPWGIVIGAFLGALAGEAAHGREGRGLLRAGWGVFVGTMVATGMKLALSGVMLFFYVKEMF
jgi:hypothetical protein